MAGSDLSVPEGLYEDAKRALRGVARVVYRPYAGWRERRHSIASFGTAFSRHGRTTTDLVDYFRWFVDEDAWCVGNGLLAAATFGELLFLWTRADHFVPYEARLLRFRQSGGTIRRVFLVGAELSDPIRLFALHRTLIRHERLGLSPRVRSARDVERALAEIEVQCDVFGVLNGTVAYLIRFPATGPTMLRTVDRGAVTTLENAHMSLWRDSEESTSWRRLNGLTLPREIREQVDADCRNVEAFASGLKPRAK